MNPLIVMACHNDLSWQDLGYLRYRGDEPGSSDVGILGDELFLGPEEESDSSRSLYRSFIFLSSVTPYRRALRPRHRPGLRSSSCRLPRSVYPNLAASTRSISSAMASRVANTAALAAVLLLFRPLATGISLQVRITPPHSRPNFASTSSDTSQQESHLFRECPPDSEERSNSTSAVVFR